MFKKPTIGPKDYISVGLSGWPERFQRTKADAALRIFLGDLPLDELLENFATQQDLERRKHGRHETLWGDVEGYLMRVVGGGKRPHSMTPTVVIAFWAAYVLHERNEAAN